MRLALATAAVLAALTPIFAPTFAMADDAPRTARAADTALDRTALERTVREPVRFPFERRGAASFERPDRSTRAPTPPVISGPFGAM